MPDAKNDTLNEVLKAIKKTQGLKDRIHKELGLDKNTIVQSTSDMYEFEYKKPDLEHRAYVILHGVCSAKWQEPKLKCGYIFQQIKHFPKTDSMWCFVRCAECGVRLDEKRAKTYLQEREIKLEKQKQDYIEEKALREEWEAEQILLGRL